MPYRIPLITKFVAEYRKLPPVAAYGFLSLISREGATSSSNLSDGVVLGQPWMQVAVVWNELTAWERGNALAELHQDVVTPLRDLESRLWALARKQDREASS